MSRIITRGEVGARAKALDLLHQCVLNRDLSAELGKGRHTAADEFGDSVG
jgi:hypothetical protein